MKLSTRIVLWAREGADTNYGLHARLRALGEPVPDWLADAIPPTNDMPSADDVATAIWMAVNHETGI